MPDPVHTHWPGDVLDLLLAEVLETEFEPVAYLIADDPADADTTWLGQGLQPRGDIDPVAEDVVSLNEHVAEVDADAELDQVPWRRTLVAVGHCPLHLDGTTHRVNHARELRQEAVAGVLYDQAPVLPDLRIDQLPEMGLEPFVGPLLIRPHQPRIPGDISGEDCGETSGDGHFPGEARPPEADIHGVLVERPVLGSAPRLSRALS